MRNRNNIDRTYYIPGIISLMFLSIICIIYLKKNTINTEERAIEIEMPRQYNPIANGRNSNAFDTAILSRPENIRKYREIKMSDNFEENNEKITEFKQSIEKLVHTKDTLNGVHLTLASTTSYNDFIKLLDICFSSTSVCHFMVYEDNIWYLYKNSDSVTVRQVKAYKEERLKNQREKQKEKIIARNIELGQKTFFQLMETLLKIWPWLISYLALGFISIRYMIKK